jgi:ABC-2 type transport system permease protein
MTAATLIARRELGSYLRTIGGYIVAAAALLIQGVLWNAFVLGNDENRLSTWVLSQFFYLYSGVVMTASVFLSMRLVAEERLTGSMVLLASSPVRERDIVLGKFLSALLFLMLMTLPSIFMPLLILVNGKLSYGHVAAGYLGLFLLGGASLAIGILGSSLTRSQLVAAIVSGGMVVGMIALHPLGKLVERPLDEVLFALGIWHVHFPPFQAGIINLRDVVYYLAVTYFALFLAIRVLEVRRWR